MPDTTVLVWTEIPVTNLEKSMAFYSDVFGFNMHIDNTGPNPIAMLGTSAADAGGHLYPGTPAAQGGSTPHLAVPDALEAAMDRCTAGGGTVVSPPITIPPGRFAYATDLDGNSIGLFEVAKA